MSDKYYTKIISEIIETEKSYLNQLEKLQKFFSEPSLEKGLLPNHVHSAVFTQLSLIYQMNSKLLEEIVDKKDDIGSTFLKLGPFLKVYSSYANNFQRALSILQQWESENEEFRAFVSATETRPEVQSKLTSLLITPIQRIPRYKLLLEELLKHSDSSCHFYTDIEGALKQIIEVAEHINQSVEDSQTLNHLLSLQRALKNQEPSIIAPGRKFIKEGVLNKVSRKGKGSQPRCFFLFSDILMYTKLPPQTGSPNSKANLRIFHDFEMRPSSLECCCVLPLRYCRVTTLFGSSNQGITFRLQCADEDLLLYSSSATEGEDWVRAIKETAHDALRKRRTLRRESSCRKAIRRTRQRKFSSSEEDSVAMEIIPKPGAKSPGFRDIFIKTDSLKSRLRSARDCLTPPKKFLSPRRPNTYSSKPSTTTSQPSTPSPPIETRGGQLSLRAFTPTCSLSQGLAQNLNGHLAFEAEREIVLPKVRNLSPSSHERKKRPLPDLFSSPWRKVKVFKKERDVCK